MERRNRKTRIEWCLHFIVFVNHHGLKYPKFFNTNMYVCNASTSVQLHTHRFLNVSWAEKMTWKSNLGYQNINQLKNKIPQRAFHGLTAGWQIM